MTSSTCNVDTVRARYTPARPEGFEVSWVGPNPFLEGFCYGSEDGYLLFTDEAGFVIGGAGKGSASGEAINAVARSRRWLAVSTRQEVTFLALPEGSTPMQAVVFPYGAHDLGVLSSGEFVAALGRAGLAVIPAEVRPEEPVLLLEANHDGFYFYRTLVLTPSAGPSVLACAGRRGGVGITAYVAGQDHQQLDTVTFTGVDIVDLCPIGDTTHPLALAALGKDGSVILFRDALKDKQPLLLKYDLVSGTAYRLLACQGDLFVLTSTGLYGLLKVAERYLEGSLAGGDPTGIVRMAMEAADASLVRERWLMVVLPDEVRNYDVELLRQQARALPPGDGSAGLARQPGLEWKHHEIKSASSKIENSTSRLISGSHIAALRSPP